MYFVYFLFPNTQQQFRYPDTSPAYSPVPFDNFGESVSDNIAQRMILPTMEKAPMLAKKALTRELGSRNPNPLYAALEEELLGEINNAHRIQNKFFGTFQSIGRFQHLYSSHIFAACALGHNQNSQILSTDNLGVKCDNCAWMSAMISPLMWSGLCRLVWSGKNHPLGNIV